MDGFKRGSDNAGSAVAGGQLTKRARFEDPNSRTQELVVSSGGKGSSGQLTASVQRTSGLQTPIVRLDGHSSEVLDVQFSGDGETLASASTDKTVNLWRVYGDNSNFGVLKGQQGAITSIAWPGSSSSPHLFAGSVDKTVATFDVTTGQIARRHRGHKGIINCVDVTRGGRRELVASASDDGLVKVWDVEAKNPIDEIELGYPVTAIRWSEDGQQIFIGGIDNDIHVCCVPLPWLMAESDNPASVRSALICAQNPSSTLFTATTTL